MAMAIDRPPAESPVQVRFPLKPLADHLGIRLGQVGGYQRDDPTAGLAAVAVALRISFRHARRLHHRGLSERQADHFAVRAGFHPLTIWPEWDRALDSDEAADGWFDE